MILENKFKKAGEFRYGRAFVETLDGKTYCINKKGKVCFECDSSGKYAHSPVYNKFKQAVIRNKTGNSVKSKIIDINGDDIIPYHDGMTIYPVDNGYEVVDYMTGKNVKIILPDGTECKFGNLYAIEYDGETKVVFDKDKFLFYDKNWNLINTIAGEKILLADDLNNYDIQQNGKWGLTDNKGNLLIPCLYDKPIYTLSRDKLYFAVELNSKIGVADKHHNMILDCNYDEIMYLKNSFLVSQNGKYFIKYLNGIVKIFPYEDFVPLLCKATRTIKYVIVKSNGRCGLCNLDGEIVLPLKFDYIESHSYESVFGDLLLVEINDKVGYYDLNGNEVIPCEYKDLTFGINDELILAEEYTKNGSGKKGYINIQNQTVIPFIYDFRTESFDNGIAIVDVDREYIKYIRTNGEDLWYANQTDTLSKVTDAFKGNIIEFPTR